jgi:hypothetical protein
LFNGTVPPYFIDSEFEVIGTPEKDDNKKIDSDKGRFEVTGLKDGKELTRYSIQTSGRSFAIVATTDKTTLTGNKDMAHIIISIVDEKGVPVLLADDEVTCTVTGPARLLGLESANNSDMTNLHDNMQRVYNGKMLCYLQTTGAKGKVDVIFSAPWLKPAAISLTVD